jgi:hypothetical protein
MANEQTIYGNTPGNIVNRGLAALQEDWTYYSNSGLYKIKTDGSDKRQLSDDWVSFINVAGDRIYYRKEDDKKIYTIKTDGSGLQNLNNDKSEYINVAGDRIYYRNGSDLGKIYTIKTDGSGRKKLNDDQSEYITVAGDYIYYLHVIYEDAEPGLADYDYDEYNIYKIKTDGSEDQKLCGNGGYFLNVVGERIYYVNYSDDLYTIKTDGTDRKKLIDKADYINVAGDWIYYGDWGLYKIKTDGSEMQQLIKDEKLLNINVAGDWIYYYNDSDGGKLYTIKIDGSGRRLVE